jgi:hypothetical protein
MPPATIESNIATADLGARFKATTTVGASPAGASETVIGTLTIADFGFAAVTQGVIVNGWAAYTLGSTPSSCQLRIRQTNIGGTVVGNTGAMTGGHNTAGFLVADDVNGFDSGAGVGVYVLTLTVAGAGSASTVSALYLTAIII